MLQLSPALPGPTQAAGSVDLPTSFVLRLPWRQATSWPRGGSADGNGGALVDALSQRSSAGFLQLVSAFFPVPHSLGHVTVDPCDPGAGRGLSCRPGSERPLPSREGGAAHLRCAAPAPNQASTLSVPSRWRCGALCEGSVLTRSGLFFIVAGPPARPCSARGSPGAKPCSGPAASPGGQRCRRAGPAPGGEAPPGAVLPRASGTSISRGRARPATKVRGRRRRGGGRRPPAARPDRGSGTSPWARATAPAE